MIRGRLGLATEARSHREEKQFQISEFQMNSKEEMGKSANNCRFRMKAKRKFADEKELDATAFLLDEPFAAWGGLTLRRTDLGGK